MKILAVLLSFIVFINAHDEKKCTTETGVPGLCVDYYQCESDKIITDGKFLHDKRTISKRSTKETDSEDSSSECSYLEKCCGLPDIETATVSTFVPPQTDKKPLSSIKNCGDSNGPTNKLTASKDNKAEFGELPWTVGVLKLESKLHVYKCGGSLIHPKVVLTNADCVKKIGKSPDTKYVARLGEYDTQIKEEALPYQDIDVVKIVIHENFNTDNDFNNIALLFLDKPANLTQNVGVVCLPPQSDTVAPADCFVSGWGKDRFGKEGRYQSIMQKIELPVVEHKKCQDELRKTRLGSLFNLHKSFMCAGGIPLFDACTGHGGSPLVCPMPGQTNKYMQVGIVSWGIRCYEGIPGVYTNVPYFRNWIEDQLVRNSIE